MCYEGSDKGGEKDRHHTEHFQPTGKGLEQLKTENEWRHDTEVGEYDNRSGDLKQRWENNIMIVEVQT